MIDVILLISEIVILLLSFFLLKTPPQRKLLRICSIVIIVIWTIHYGAKEFISFNLSILTISLVTSYLLYLLSLLIVRTKFSKDNLLLTKSLKLKGKLNSAFQKESLRNIYTSTFEEMLYRWFILNALCEVISLNIIGIVFTIALFTAVHYHKKIAIVQMLDIFAFSCAITIFFYFTVNPIYSILIHILRNQFVISQKYIDTQKERQKMSRYMKILTERTFK